MEGTCDENGNMKCSINIADGSTYYGDLLDNIFHGQGTLKWADGRVYTGSWNRGVMHGEGTITLKTGESISGVFIDGNLDMSPAAQKAAKGALIDKHRQKVIGAMTNYIQPLLNDLAANPKANIPVNIPVIGEHVPNAIRDLAIPPQNVTWSSVNSLFTSINPATPSENLNSRGKALFAIPYDASQSSICKLNNEQLSETAKNTFFQNGGENWIGMIYFLSEVDGTLEPNSVSGTYLTLGCVTEGKKKSIFILGSGSDIVEDKKAKKK